MYSFSPVTLKLLKESGWTADRSINIDPYKAFFEETNQPYSDTVLEFLRSFGELKISFADKDDPLYIEYYVSDIEKGILDKSVLDKYSELIGKPLCSIGISGSGDRILMTIDGQVYEVFDRVVNKIANSGEEAIETICTQGCGLGSIPWPNKQE